MPIHLTIVSPEGLAFHEEVEGVVLPGSEGDFGVLEGHERFVTALRVGEAAILKPGAEIYAAISSGFAEVRGEKVTVLVDACELSNEIDRERAEVARERAERALEELKQRSEADATDVREYEQALTHAVTRVAVSGKGRP